MDGNKVSKVLSKKDLEELQQHKISWKLGLMLVAIGISFISLGTTQSNIVVRLAGLIIVTGGGTATAKRTYERIMAKRKERE